jgi:hypothetical protein
MKLRKIGYLSLGYLMALFGFIAGLLQSILLIVQAKAALLNPELFAVSTEQATIILGRWPLVVLGMILVTTLLAFIGGLLSALIYNKLFVKMTGGLSLELDK